MLRHSLIAGFGLAMALCGASAQAGDDLCLDLSAKHERSRFGTQYMLISEGDQHYKVSFVGNQCGLIAHSSNIKIKTGGKPGRICSSGSTVSTRDGTCKVAGIEAIDAKEFERLRSQGRSNV